MSTEDENHCQPIGCRFLSYCCKLFITTLLHRPNIPLSPCTALGLRSGPPILDHQARLVFWMETFTHNPLRRRGVASHALGTVGFSRCVRSRGESHCVIVIVATIVLGGWCVDSNCLAIIIASGRWYYFLARLDSNRESISTRQSL